MEAQVQSEVPVFAPVCHVCKSQDETLRAVTFPFVFSVVFMTFRRSFGGVYCKKHRRWYLFLASLISSAFGWLGIPFGLVYTPMVLGTLAKGGIQNPTNNFQLLVAVADKKLLTGDTAGAIRCLEESLRFQDDPEIRKRLTALYQTNPTSTSLTPSHPVKQIGGLFITLFASTMIGVAIGILDLLLGDLLSPFYNSSNSIFIDILSWVPFVIMMFLGLLAVQSMVGAYLTRNKLTSGGLTLALSLVASFTVFYNISITQSLFRNLIRLIQAFYFSSQDGFFAVRSLLTSGAGFLIANNYEFGKLSGIIYIVLLLGGLGLCIYASFIKGQSIAQWQGRLAQIREAVSNRDEISMLVPWATVGGMVLIALFATLLLFPGRLINVEKAFIYNDQAQAQSKVNHYEETMQYFQKSAAIWPDSVFTHVGLATGYINLKKFDLGAAELKTALEIDPDSFAASLIMGLSLTTTGEYDEAIKMYQKVALMQPTLALPHSLLAVLYYETDQLDQSKKELETAIAHSAKDAQASSILAGYYLQVLDYPMAEKYTLQAIKLSNNPSDNLLLARIYMAQKKLTQAELAIEEAGRINANPPSLVESKAVLAEFRGDYQKAEMLVLTALKDYPEDSSLLGELSFIHFKMGQFENAVEDGRKALEQNPYEGPVYVNMAFAYQALGNHAEALKSVQKGLTFMPKYDRAHYILGLCYMDNGMKAEAIKEFETFLKLYWERPYAADEKLKAEEYLKQLK